MEIELKYHPKGEITANLKSPDTLNLGEVFYVDPTNVGAALKELEIRLNNMLKMRKI